MKRDVRGCRKTSEWSSACCAIATATKKFSPSPLQDVVLDCTLEHLCQNLGFPYHLLLKVIESTRSQVYRRKGKHSIESAPTATTR